MMFKIYKTERFQHKRPAWVAPLLFKVSPARFLQPTHEKIKEELDNVYNRIISSGLFGKKSKYKVCKDEESVSIVNENGIPCLTYNIEKINTEQ